jgi:hypothetical protein
MPMKQPVIGFHQDEEHYWVAELQCGHNQHVRHNPPWFVRPWTTTEEGRNGALGMLLECRLCDEERVAWNTP